MNSIRIMAVLALSAASSAVAQSYTFDAALAKAGDVASVQLALQEQRDAREQLARVQQDPLATRLEQLQAQQRADLADARAARAPHGARAQIAGAYLNVLGARDALPVLQKSVQVAEQGVNIANIRAKNGSGTAQALRDAQNQLGDARQNFESAQANLKLAQQVLRDLIGPYDDLQAPKVVPAVPDAGIVEELFGGSPNARQARQSVALSEAQLGVMDPSYTARKDIEAAQSQLASARKNLTTALTNERQALQSLFDAAVREARELAVLRESAASANAKWRNDQRRLAGGLISPFELLQSELGAQQADLNAVQGRNEYLRAYYNLFAGGGQ